MANSCFFSAKLCSTPKIQLFSFVSIRAFFVLKTTATTLHVDDLFGLIERLGKPDRIDLASDVIGDFLRAWGLHNVAYAALNMPSGQGARRWSR